MQNNHAATREQTQPMNVPVTPGWGHATVIVGFGLVLLMALIVTLLIVA